MGREATVTQEQVAAAADAIAASGSKPTLRAVREQIGGGSMGTIARLLGNWKAGQARGQAADLTLPPALQRSILDFMSAELSAARAPLEAEIAEQQQTAADLASENERQAVTIADQVGELETLAAEKAATEGKAGQLAVDFAGAKDEAARERKAAEDARTELAKAQLRLEAMPRLEAEIAALRTDLINERAARIAAEQAAAVLGAQREDLTARVTELRAGAEAARDQLLALQSRSNEQAQHLADARLVGQAAEARAADLARQLDVAYAAAEAARAAAAAAGEAAAELRGRISAAEAGPATSSAGRRKG